MRPLRLPGCEQERLSKTQSRNDKTMRVLVTCVSAYGHLQPLLPLAKALAGAGHEVAVATGPDMRPRAEVAGFTALQAGITPGTAFGRLAGLFPDQEYNRLKPAEILGW